MTTERLEPRKENNLSFADVADNQLILKRYDGSALTFGEFKESPRVASVDPMTFVHKTVGTITVTGTGFVPGPPAPKIEFNGSPDSATTRVSDTVLTADQFQVNRRGDVLVTVETANGVSNGIPIVVTQNPNQPTLTGISPNTAVAGTPTTITLTGDFPDPGSFASVREKVSGQDHWCTPVYVSRTTLTFDTLVAMPAVVYNVQVMDEMGSLYSATLQLTLT